MQPYFENVQSHYDLSDDFFALFLDPTRTYSCAYFNDPNAPLEEAQRAKIDLSLGKCELKPGMKLLDIGCGWGATALHAAEHFRASRHDAFFKKCKEILPGNGIMMLHSIVTPSLADLREAGIEFTHEDVKFARFIRDEIFPGGQLCPPERVKSVASQNGFDVYHIQPLRLHYARTLDYWAESLAKSKEQAIAITS